MADPRYVIDRPGVVDIDGWRSREYKARQLLQQRGQGQPRNDVDRANEESSRAGPSRVRTRPASSDHDPVNRSKKSRLDPTMLSPPQHKAASDLASTSEQVNELDSDEEGSASVMDVSSVRVRKKYNVNDFYGSHSTKEQVEKWYNLYPCLQKRNFYVIQNHHATAKHFDLRLHLDGATLSWAIPKGLSRWRRKGEHRMGVETYPHCIEYTMYEGSKVGVTAVWDLGTYKILPTKKKQKTKEAYAKQGFDMTNTDDEDAGNKAWVGPEQKGMEDKNGDEDFRRVPGRTEDEIQEDKLAEKYYYAAHLPLPARYGAAAQPVRKSYGNDAHRGFVLELNGQRYQGLKLLLHRSPSDIKFIKFPKAYAQANPDDPRARPDAPAEVRRDWLIDLVEAGKEDETLGEVSLLTGRTISEIRAAPSRHAWNTIRVLKDR